MGMPISEILNLFEIIENTPGTNDKISILSSASNDENVKNLFDVAVNPYIITQISETLIDKIHELKNEVDAKHVVTNSDKYTELFLNFEYLKTSLSERTISGNNMLRIVAEFLKYADTFDPRASKWFERILSKKLRIGISESNCMKALNLKFRSISLQAAEDTYKLNKNCEKLISNIQNYIIEPKIDGFRYIVLFMDNEIKFISRSGREKSGDMYPTLKECLMAQYDKLEGYAVDCEVTSGDWNETASAIQSVKNKKDDSNLKLNVFDILTISQLYNKRCDLLLRERMELRNNLITEIPGRIEIVRNSPAISIDNIMGIFTTYVANGGEGVMLKDLNSLYKFKRSDDWLKVKQIMSGDYLCTGMYEGNGKNKGKLGGVTIILDDPKIECKVGGGFKDSQLEHFWTHKDEIVNHIIEVEFRGKTKDGNLRHPEFLRIRFDKE